MIKRLAFFHRLGAAAAGIAALSAAPLASLAPKAPAIEGQMSDFASEPLEWGITGWYAQGMPEERFLQSELMNDMPYGARVAELVAQGFDRIVRYVDGYAVFSSPLTPGVIPAGWQTLEHAGPIGVMP